MFCTLLAFCQCEMTCEYFVMHGAENDTAAGDKGAAELNNASRTHSGMVILLCGESCIYSKTSL